MSSDREGAAMQQEDALSCWWHSSYSSLLLASRPEAVDMANYESNHILLDTLPSGAVTATRCGSAWSIQFAPWSQQVALGAFGIPAADMLDALLKGQRLWANLVQRRSLHLFGKSIHLDF